MNVALPLVCLRDEQISHVPADAILVANGIPAKDLLQDTSIVQSPITVLSLNHADHLGRGLSLILETTNLDRGQRTIRGIRSRVRQLLLDELILGQGVVFELPALEGICPRS